MPISPTTTTTITTKDAITSSCRTKGTSDKDVFGGAMRLLSMNLQRYSDSPPESVNLTIDGVDMCDMVDEVPFAEVDGDLAVGWAFLEDPRALLLARRRHRWLRLLHLEATSFSSHHKVRSHLRMVTTSLRTSRPSAVFTIPRWQALKLPPRPTQYACSEK